MKHDPCEASEPVSSSERDVASVLIIPSERDVVLISLSKFRQSLGIRSAISAL